MKIMKKYLNIGHYFTGQKPTKNTLLCLLTLTSLLNGKKFIAANCEQNCQHYRTHTIFVAN